MEDNKEKILKLKALMGDAKDDPIETMNVKFSIRNNIDRNLRFNVEPESFVVLTTLNSILERDDMASEFCDKLLELPMTSYYISEYCFSILWHMLKKGLVVKSQEDVVEIQEENWPAIYKMIKVSKI